jgi:hypothetical protein
MDRIVLINNNQLLLLLFDNSIIQNYVTSVCSDLGIPASIVPDEAIQEM